MLTYGYGSSGSNNGQISGITDGMDNGRTASYTYDSLGRLGAAGTAGSTAYSAWGFSWTYDRYGNRTAQTVTAGSGLSGSLLVSATTNQITSSGFSYDASGNMTNDAYNAMTYDAASRLITAANGSSSGAYAYDGNGLRAKKCVPNCSSPTTTTVYIFSGSKVIAEYDNGAAVGLPSREYIYSGGTQIAKFVGSTITYYHQDHLSNRLVTSNTGSVVEQMGHMPYGENWYDTGSEKLKFTTYERDAESTNDYAMARYHVNRLGRFSSPDPLSGNVGNPQSLNHYIYAGNDPVNLFDPTGLASCDSDNPPPVCTESIEEDSGGGSCSFDGITADCSFAHNPGFQQCDNACQISTTSYVTLNGIIIASYTQVWDFTAFANDAGYYAEAGPGAMFSTMDDAGQAAGEYFGPLGTQLNREFFGKVLKPDSEGFYSFDLEDVGPPCSADCHSGPGDPSIGVAVWHTHPPPNDYLSTSSDRRRASTMYDYVTEDMGGSYTTFRISPWEGGVRQYPSLAAGPGALNNGNIAFMCQLSGGVGFPATPMCH